MLKINTQILHAFTSSKGEYDDQLRLRITSTEARMNKACSMEQ